MGKAYPRGYYITPYHTNDEIASETAAHLELLADMDDLVIQFDTTDLGRHFIGAWKRMFIIVDVNSRKERREGYGIGFDSPIRNLQSVLTANNKT